MKFTRTLIFVFLILSVIGCGQYSKLDSTPAQSASVETMSDNQLTRGRFLKSQSRRLYDWDDSSDSNLFELINYYFLFSLFRSGQYFIPQITAPSIVSPVQPPTSLVPTAPPTPPPTVTQAPSPTQAPAPAPTAAPMEPTAQLVCEWGTPALAEMLWPGEGGQHLDRFDFTHPVSFLYQNSAATRFASRNNIGVGCVPQEFDGNLWKGCYLCSKRGIREELSFDYLNSLVGGILRPQITELSSLALMSAAGRYGQSRHGSPGCYPVESDEYARRVAIVCVRPEDGIRTEVSLDTLQSHVGVPINDWKPVNYLFMNASAGRYCRTVLGKKGGFFQEVDTQNRKATITCLN